MIQSMLLAVDMSPSAKIATHYAIDLARKLEGSVHAVFVIDARLSEIGFYGEDVRPEVVAEAMKLRRQTEQQLEEQGDSLLASVKREVEAAGVECRVERLGGVPAVRLLEAAADSDLIVMGAARRVRGPG
jgi:nucleotide-binding universal stress UspA family protein